MKQFIAALALSGLSALAGATALEEGIAAYRRGENKAAFKLLAPQARQGDAEAQYVLGRLYYYPDTGIRQSYREAARWFGRAARQGHAAAQYKFGGMYFSGRGVAQSDRLTLEWWRRAAEQRHPVTLNNLGALFAAGRGVPRDPIFGYALQVLARDAGDEDAVANLRAKEASMSEAELAAGMELASEMRQPGRLGELLAQRLKQEN
jgi:hypothetical protein